MQKKATFLFSLCVPFRKCFVSVESSERMKNAKWFVGIFSTDENISANRRRTSNNQDETSE